MIKIKSCKFKVNGMSCAACQTAVERGVKKVKGVESADVSLLAGRMTVKFDEAVADEAKIIKAVENAGYEADIYSGGDKTINKNPSSADVNPDGEEKHMRTRLIWSIALLLPLMYVSMGHMLGLPTPPFLVGTENSAVSALTQLLLSLPVLYINREFFLRGFKALAKFSPNMDSLVALGSSASFLYGLFAIYRMVWGLGHGEIELAAHYSHRLYFESAAMITALVTIGKYLEARSKAKTSDALRKLMDLAPKTASVIRGGKETVIAASDIVVGDVVVVKPGASIPVDGEVIDGEGYVDQSAITGESVPAAKNSGDPVISATVNVSGAFTFRAQKVGEDTTLSQIIRLVDEAGGSKAPIARIADKVSGIFVPIVVAIAVVCAAVWLIAGQDFEFALTCAVSVLVISCPCALGLATPVAITVGCGRAAQYGILIKSAEALERLGSVDTALLDKTGTLTLGKPTVTDIKARGIPEKEFTAILAGLEKNSEHPIAKAISDYASANNVIPAFSENFKSTAGRGISADFDGKNYIAGNEAFLRENGISDAEFEKDASDFSSDGKTPVLLAGNQKYLGCAAVSDKLKPSAKSAVERLRALGLRVIMLTGDNRLAAGFIAKSLGIDKADVISEVLPADKEKAVRSVIEAGGHALMAGDGVNDAPALTRADVGIAMGGGTDIAAESADAVLMSTSPDDIATAVKLSRAVVSNIKMNLFWAFFYNILGIPIAAGILYPAFHITLSPMIGAAAMSLSSVCVVTNALRLRFFKDKERFSDIADTGVKNNNVNKNNKGVKIMTKTLKIEGMMCEHCVAHVKKALSSIPDVTEVSVSLQTKSAEVKSGKALDDSVLISAVKDAGYEVTDIK